MYLLDTNVISELRKQSRASPGVTRYENAIDKQIAATALIHGLTLVTRNTDDFADSGVSVINPFDP